MNKNQKDVVRYRMVSGFAQFIIILTGVLVIILSIVFFAFKNGQIKITPSRKQVTVSPTLFTTQSPDGDMESWKTYDAINDGFIESEKYGNFTFKYPREFELDHASGPADFSGGSNVDLVGNGIDLTISTVNFNGSTRDQANTFIQGILNKEPGYINCDLLPSCDLNTFTIQETTLPNNLSVTVVSGPYFDNKVFDIYFIQPNKNTGLSFWFSYKDRDKWKQTRDQILSTFKFLE